MKFFLKNKRLKQKILLFNNNNNYFDKIIKNSATKK